MIVCIWDYSKAEWLRQALLVPCLTAICHLSLSLAETNSHLVSFSKPLSQLEHAHVTKVCLRRPKEKWPMASAEDFPSDYKLNVYEVIWFLPPLSIPFQLLLSLAQLYEL